MFESILIQGLIRGGVYALLAVGFSLIFGVARMINLAHTCFYMLAAYAVYIFAKLAGLPPAAAAVLSLLVTTFIAIGAYYTLSQVFNLNRMVSIVLSIVLVGVTAYGSYYAFATLMELSLIKSICLASLTTVFVGAGTYKIFIDRVREHHVTVMLITLALAMIFQEWMILAFTSEPLGTPAFITGYWEIIGVKVTFQHLLTFGIAVLVLIGVWALLTKTRLGIAIRATAQDSEIASLMGINVSRVLLIAMGLAGFLAAIAGTVVAPTLTLEPRMWMSPLVMVMAIVVLGGLGSVKGSFIGAFIIGFVEVLVVFLLPAGAFLKGAIALLVMVIILLVRPEGLFGVAFEEERL